MTRAANIPALPSCDTHWRTIDTAMRRHGYTGDALIESLHAVQECFGYLDTTAIRFIARSLRVPLSKVYGVATFYHFFALQPPAKHQCVVCMGTACVLRGAAQLLEQIERASGIGVGERTADGRLGLSVARCVGTCGLAPLIILDGRTIGPVKPGDSQRLVTDAVRNDGG